MEGDLIKINRWLMPLSWIYGAVTAARNWLFDIHVLRSVSYPVPVINVGNLTVGGTGKTPHVEYLIRLLSANYKVAVLSRGYKRKTKGFVLATKDSTMQEIGDEPWQVKQKFQDIYVAVDANRRRGISRLLSSQETKDVDVILLDDAYQHRYVKPSTNILLVDYHRMITDDCLLPAGRLRESAKGCNRAKIVIVTKCPSQLTPMEYRVVQNALDLRPYQHLFFSTFRYGELQGLFNEKTRPITSIEDEEHIMLLTGIASPEQMMMDLHRYTRHITPVSFPDHHFFTREDAVEIEKQFKSIPSPRFIITTEKDATRLRNCPELSELVKQSLYVIPIEVDILRNEKTTFNEKILKYVRKDSSNSTMA